jgi:hypothetical protein
MWSLDACVKAGVLVDLVCLMTTLKERVRRLAKSPQVSGYSKQGIGQAKNDGAEGVA